MRIGLNSGPVIVGAIGDDLRMDYTAQGYTVGLAARVEQLAEPGRAYLTQHTAQLAEGFFRLRDLGRSKIAGTRSFKAASSRNKLAASARMSRSVSRLNSAAP